MIDSDGFRPNIGIVLMNRLMDQVDFRTTDDSRNECCLLKYRKTPEQA